VFGHPDRRRSAGVIESGRLGLALVALSVVERRLDAVRAVLAGATATEVAAQVGVSRQSLHTWIARYLVDGVAGLADRSHRPSSCPHQVSAMVEVLVAELRRKHPRWGEADPDGAAAQARRGGRGSLDGHDQSDSHPAGPAAAAAPKAATGLLRPVGAARADAAVGNGRGRRGDAGEPGHR